MENKKFTIAHLGLLHQLNGKTFLKEMVYTTSMEVSITSIPAGEKSLYHCHRQNEELMIILGGRGIIKLDGEVYDVTEGDVIRIAPAVARGLENNSSSPLLFICIQAKANSLEAYTLGDGFLAK